MSVLFSAGYNAHLFHRAVRVGVFDWQDSRGIRVFSVFFFFFFLSADLTFNPTMHNRSSNTVYVRVCVWLYLVSKTCIMSREVRKMWRIWSRAGLCCVLLINTFMLIAHMKAQCFQINKTLLGHSCSWVSLKPKIKCGKKAAPRHHFLVPPNVI